MSFSFDFSDDDIDDRGPSEKTAIEAALPAEPLISGRGVQEMPVVKHNLNGLLASLPDRISYSTTTVSTPHSDRRLLIPRRALFDIRLQTIAESNVDDAAQAHSQEVIGSGESDSRTSQPFIGFGDSDIEKDVYEGGFKTWEGATDLACFLLERDVAQWSHFESVIELGCGTGLPTLVLFAWEVSLHASAHSKPNSGRNFTLADYNYDALRLVTLPNILLVWALYSTQKAFDPRPPSLDTQSSGASTLKGGSEAPSLRDGEGDLVITPELLTAFTSFLSASEISLNLVSGPWVSRQPSSPSEGAGLPNTFLECLDLSPSCASLVLAAETVYSPDSISSFCSVLLDILDGSESKSMGLIAAKQVYFGVGGGVAEFKRSVREASLGRGGKGLILREVEGMDRVLAANTPGVGRWIGEIFLE